MYERPATQETTPPSVRTPGGVIPPKMSHNLLAASLAVNLPLNQYAIIHARPTQPVAICPAGVRLITRRISYSTSVSLFRPFRRRALC